MRPSASLLAGGGGGHATSSLSPTLIDATLDHSQERRAMNLRNLRSFTELLREHAHRLPLPAPPLTKETSMTLRTFLNLLRALARDYHPTTENGYDGCEHIRYRQPDKPPACPITLVAGELPGLRFPVDRWQDAAHILGLHPDDAYLIATAAYHAADCPVITANPRLTWLRRALLATFDQGGHA